MSYKYFPIEFSCYEDYVKYLKEKGLALEAPNLNKQCYDTRRKVDNYNKTIARQ